MVLFTYGGFNNLIMIAPRPASNRQERRAIIAQRRKKDRK